jgi:hypothetical protein
MKLLHLTYSQKNMNRVCKFLGINESDFKFDRVMMSDRGNYNYRTDRYRVILSKGFSDHWDDCRDC